MNIVDIIRERLNREPFEPFVIVSSSGRAYEVRDPRLVVLMKTRVFIAEPRSDKWSEVPYLHVAGVESLSGGPRRRRSA